MDSMQQPQGWTEQVLHQFDVEHAERVPSVQGPVETVPSVQGAVERVPFVQGAVSGWPLDGPTAGPTAGPTVRRAAVEGVGAEGPAESEYCPPHQVAALAQRPRTTHRRLSARPASTATQRFWSAARTLLTPDDRPVRLTDAITRIALPVATGRRICVVGAHGGAGSTTVALCLASLAAIYRGDPVALVDASVAHGGLLTRLTSAPAMSVEAAARHLRGASAQSRPALLRGQAPHVFSPASPSLSDHVLDGIQRHAALTFVDAASVGTACADTACVANGYPGGAGYLANASVIVAENTVRGSAAVQGCLSELRHVGMPSESAVVIFTERVAGSGVGRDWLEGEVSSMAAAQVFHVPPDRHLAGAAQVRLDLLSPGTSMALTHIAAAVIEASTGVSGGCDVTGREVAPGVDSR
ncbi:MAG: hypothetical protein WA991_04125 [Ornithinimicrobium sp.]